MRIVLTTDDGADAAGLAMLAAIVDEMHLGPAQAVAPDRNRSGCGSSLCLKGRLKYWAAAPESLAVPMTVIQDATPIDCVRYALQHLEPELFIVGINNGANVGHNMLTSGTCCAAMFAARWGRLGVPAIAVSQHRGPGGLDLSKVPERLPGLLRYAIGRIGCHRSWIFANINLADPRDPYRGVMKVQPGIGGYDGDIIARPLNIEIRSHFYTSADRADTWKYLDDNCLSQGYDTVSFHGIPLVAGSEEMGLGGVDLEIINGEDVPVPRSAGGR